MVLISSKLNTNIPLHVATWYLSRVEKKWNLPLTYVVYICMYGLKSHDTQRVEVTQNTQMCCTNSYSYSIAT